MTQLVITPAVEGGRIVFELSGDVRRLALTPEEWERVRAVGDDLAEFVRRQVRVGSTESGDSPLY